MNNNNKSGCFKIVIYGLLFVLCPIVLVLNVLLSAPVGLKLFLCLWIVVVTLCFTFIQDKATRITLSIIPTLLYSIAYSSWYAKDVLDGYFDDGGLGDTIGSFLIPFATFVPLMFLGKWFRSKIDNQKEIKRQNQIIKLSKDIEDSEIEIQQLEVQLNRRSKIDSFIKLLALCGSETVLIENNPTVSNIKELVTAKREKEAQIRKLRNELRIKTESQL